MYDKVTCLKWFCGHYHVDKIVDNVRFMYNDILTLSDVD